MSFSNILEESNGTAGPSLQYWKYEAKMNGWNTPAEYKDYVHPHWLKYEEPNPMLHHLLGFLYIIFMFFSLLGNGIVIYIFVTSKNLLTSSNMLIVNLAICDFLMMLKTPVFIVNSFNEGPVFGSLGCQIYGLIGSFTGPGAAVTNAAISYDRYKCITDPLGERMSRGKTAALILGLWVYCSPVALLPFFEVWNRHVPEGYLTSCTFDYMTETTNTKLFVLTIWVWCYVLPLSVIAYCYTKIVMHVAQHEAQLKAQAEKMNVQSLRSGGAASARQELRVAKVGASLTCLFLLSWTPYFIVAFIAAFGNRLLVTPFVSMIPACTCKAAACIDPFVYAINHPKYRQELQKRIPWLCVHEPNDPAESNGTINSGSTEQTA